MDIDGHISCSMTHVALKLVHIQGGDAAVAELLRVAGSSRERSYLENVEHWVSLEEACALLDAGVEVADDPLFARRVGEQTLRQHAGTQVATLLRSLGSVEAVLQAVARSAAKLSTVTDMSAVEVSPGRAVVTAVARPGFVRHRLHCEWASGLLSGTPILFGLPLAHVVESECQARGDAQCHYTVRWDAAVAAAATDPQQRVTALEAQLLATSERLHSVYEIASDLVSTEDLETVLHRIVERVADAVHAPVHVLAVCSDEDSELQVYSRGIGRAQAQRLALEAPTGNDSMLVADVVSSRRAYGQLIACYPGATQFFPQEREMLSLYAKHAAAVLDMALALRESAHRHEQVSALLALSHAMAKAGTSLEVAERLAAAVPEVVDCDRMAVWLWNEHEQRLRVLAAWGRKPEDAESLQEVSIRREDTPHLAAMLAEPQPHFFYMDTDDLFIRELMLALDVVALSVVPIVARGVFLGILTVSVSARPERLRPDSDLLERLTGVAALAAPAIQNGQLVDELNHRANHDGLTGLLNSVGFKHRIDAALESVADQLDAGAASGQADPANGVGADSDDTGQVGLLFVDLNDFKSINDLHGHEAGDELIRQAAARLSSLCRGHDDVARLGGDEFAIVLTDVRREEQVRAAERRVRETFTEPFPLGAGTITISASVGGGVWPDDGHTVTELVRYADAAMYVDKARSRAATLQTFPPLTRSS